MNDTKYFVNAADIHDSNINIEDEEKTISSDVEITSTSAKDQYESNNDFESATNITIYEFSQYIENEMIVEGTLNRDPWYKLFWRDIDEDYYRIDVFGDAYIDIHLSMPSDVNYDLELYEKIDETTSDWSQDWVPCIGFSRVNAFGISERITINNENSETSLLTAGSYYVRVYSRDDTYNDEENYILSYSLTYQTQETQYISKLRFNKGAKAAFWKSDFDPFNENIFDIQNNFLFNPLSYSPIHDSIESYATEFGITNCVFYIWDTQWRNGLANYLDGLIDRLSLEENLNSEIRVTLENVNTTGEFIGHALKIVSIASGLPIVDALGEGINGIMSTALLMTKVIFPQIWSTTLSDAIDYFVVIRNILQCNNDVNSTEVLIIRYKYQYGSGNISFVNSINSNESFLYNSDSIGAYNSDSHTFGKIYPITNNADFLSFITTCEVEEKPDINTCENIKKMFVDDIESGFLIPGKYYWYKFVAPFSGDFRFYSSSDIDVCGELFTNIVNGDSIEGRVKVDNHTGENNNFSIVYSILQGATVFIRVRGSTWVGQGSFAFSINGAEHIHDYTFFHIYNSTFNHLSKCECVEYIYEPHKYMPFGTGKKCTICGHYTEGPTSSIIFSLRNDVKDFEKTNGDD